MASKTPDPVKFKNGILILMDQRKLPEKKTYVKIKSVEAAAKAIKNMTVRGAPAIGVTAAYGMVLGNKNSARAAKMLLASRPTAVNLQWAVNKMLAVKSKDFQKLLKEAIRIDQENKKLCSKIAAAGAKLIKKSSYVMTHCNAGPLATGGIGTALGVIYAARKKIRWVYVKETRPRMQGAKLTTWELREWGIPYRLITDGMEAHTMNTARVDAVIVGADRIAANGDTANKIGTYSLAVSAKYHKVPFYIAAPYSTIDFDCRTGKSIAIEERGTEEVLKINGKPISARGTKAVNPSFDVTPACLISAIITEKGIIKNPNKQKLQKLYGK